MKKVRGYGRIKVTIRMSRACACGFYESDAAARRRRGKQQEEERWTRKRILRKLEKVIKEGPYDDTWDSLCEHPTPRWYEKGNSVSLFTGAFTVCRPLEMSGIPRYMYQKGSRENLHHETTYGTLDKFGYKDFIPMFRAEKFDPEAWIKLFEEAGARFVVPVAEHHDGFQMYESSLSPWNAANMGPKQDILGKLKAEAEKRGMVSAHPPTGRSITGFLTEDGRFRSQM